LLAQHYHYGSHPAQGDWSLPSTVSSPRLIKRLMQIKDWLVFMSKFRMSVTQGIFIYLYILFV